MHYKTTSLTDSTVGRAFLKLATDKGLITIPEAPTTSVKEAFQQLDAQRPDEHLDSNVLKLCAGLRAQGLNSYAENLENKFMQYKQANAFYDVSGETGDDVVNQAHPEGSHAMKDMEGDATIETILDRAKKIQQVISKMPTGKLASRDALNAARIILAQTQTQPSDHFETVMTDIKQDIEMAVAGMDAKLGQILVVASTAYRPDWHTALNFIVSGPVGGLGLLGDAVIEYFKSHKKHLQELKNTLDGSKRTFDQDPSQENLQAIKKIIDEIKDAVDGMPADANLDPLKKEFDTVVANSQKTLDQANKKYAGLHDASTTTSTTPIAQTTPEQTAAIKQTDDLVAKIKLSTKIDENTKERLITWLSPLRGALNNPATTSEAAKKISAAEKKWTAEGII